MTKPAISIITPTYNCGKYIENAIQSVLEQSYQDYEFIIIDDGSTDNTEEIIKSYQHRRKLRYIKQTNAGQASARNRGLNESTGEYIAFLDADDSWDKYKLEKQRALFKNDKIGVIYSDLLLIDSNNTILPYKRNSEYLQFRRGNVTNFLIFDNFVPFSSVMIKKKYLDLVGGFDENIIMGDDWDVLLRLSTCCEFDYTTDELILYRIGRAEQLSNKIEMRYHEQDKIVNKFINLYPNLLTTKKIKKASAYRYRSRGYYYSEKNFSVSINNYLKAAMSDQFNCLNLTGILRAIVLNLPGLKKLFR